MPFVVAMDGPAGTGKGTITKLVSQELGLVNVDTGAIYRSIALETLNRGFNPQENQQEIIDLVDEVKIEIENKKGEQTILLNGTDVTNQIRTPEVTNLVSQVSSIVEVRLKVTDIERSFAKENDIIMEGRDIGTYVFPNADVKIYLDASPEERAKRRFLQNEEKGIHTPYEQLLEEINRRDYNDKHKEIGSLKVAEDAIVIDSTTMSIEEVKNRVIEIINQAKNRRQKWSYFLKK